MEIAPATAQDVERMIAGLDGEPAAQHHVRNR
jgi:hypothetical protein